MKNTNLKKYTLCAVQGCCPTVEFCRDKIIIKDDFGGKVRLNSSQWKDLIKLPKENR